MEKQIFKETGLESIAWFIQVFKKHPEKRGYSFIRNENINGYTGNYPKLTAQVEALVGGGYLQKQGKPDNPRSTKYVVTSFGHRYLDQHREEIGSDEAEPTVPVSEALAAAKERVNEKSRSIGHATVEKVSDLLGKPFTPSVAPEFVPSVPETPEQRKKRLGKSYTIDRRAPEEDEDGPDDAFDDIRTPKVRAVAEDMPEPTAEPQPGDDEGSEDTSDLVKTLKKISGEILYERHAKEVTVVDLIEKIENDR